MDTLQEIAKLESLYEKEITIPKVKRGQKIIIAPVGYIGSGKSNLMKILSKKLHLLRISNDELRLIEREHNLRGHEHIVAVNIARKYLSEGYSIACDFDCSGEKSREILKAESLLAGAKVFLIKVNPPKSWIIKKVMTSKYSKKDLFTNKLSRLSAVVNSFRLRKIPDINYDFVFNPASRDFEKEIEEFIKDVVIGDSLL